MIIVHMALLGLFIMLCIGLGSIVLNFGMVLLVGLFTVLAMPFKAISNRKQKSVTYYDYDQEA